MARVKRVENSRKPHVCGRTGHEIPKGAPYLTASPGFRARPKYRCVDHPFRPSELTTSAASEPLAAIESFEDAASAGFDSIEDLETAWQELGEALQEYVDMRDQALEAWEYGNSQLEELRDTAQAALDEWEGHSIEEYSGDIPEEPGEEPDPEEEPDVHETWEGMVEDYEDYTQHIADQTEEALSVVGSLDV
jgi:hypothetical protein